MESRIEAEFQLPFSLYTLGHVPLCKALCVQECVAVLVRTRLIESPKETLRVCFGNWGMVL